MTADHAPTDRLSLARVFNLGGTFAETSRADFATLGDAIQRGEIRVCALRLPDADPRLDDRRWQNRFSGNSSAHQRLCGVGALWLEAQGRRWSAVRGLCAYGVGYIADVTTTDDDARRIVVEAGDTQTRKVWTACAERTAVLVIPYDDGRSGTTGQIAAFFESALPIDDVPCVVRDEEAAARRIAMDFGLPWDAR